MCTVSLVNLQGVNTKHMLLLVECHSQKWQFLHYPYVIMSPDMNSDCFIHRITHTHQ